ncbi:hypothetical protein [Sphingorhabdus rigui]|nr:hypothetical protein [Sphingorhabdus rigui]
MANSDTQKKSMNNINNGSAQGTATNRSKPNQASHLKATNKSAKSRGGRTKGQPTSRLPSWFGTVASVMGAVVAVGAGLYATRNQWLPKAEGWKNEFSAAFANDETGQENFDQTRSAGAEFMRDNPGDDWGEVDNMSDASFPASDPPSFNPGTAG